MSSEIKEHKTKKDKIDDLLGRSQDQTSVSYGLRKNKKP